MGFDMGFDSTEIGLVLKRFASRRELSVNFFFIDNGFTGKVTECISSSVFV